MRLTNVASSPRLSDSSSEPEDSTTPGTEYGWRLLANVCATGHHQLVPEAGLALQEAQTARIRLFFGLCSTSARPNASSSGGRYMPNLPERDPRRDRARRGGEPGRDRTSLERRQPDALEGRPSLLRGSRQAQSLTRSSRHKRPGG